MSEQIQPDAHPTVTHITPTNRADLRAGVGLGYFSLGLGLFELLAPKVVARLVGASTDGPGVVLIRAIGARELISGVGLLRRPRSPGWFCARVVGDLMDLTLLGRQLATSRSSRNGVLFATAAVAGVTALDTLSAASLSEFSCKRAV